MTDAHDAQPTVDTPGGWLKQERERQGLSVQRIATDMHLSTTIIEAIEADRFATLGAPVFAKGHLRKYAQLLGLSSQRIIELYERLDDTPKEEDPVPLTQRAPDPTLRPTLRTLLAGGERSSHVWVWAAAGSVLLAMMVSGWWWTQLRSTSSLHTTRSVVGESAPRVATPPTPAPPTGAAGDAASLPMTPPTRTVRALGAPPPGKLRVRLTFMRESWVEMYDASGNRMLYDVGRVDFPRLVDVEPPALVVLGDAAAVTTEVNGQALFIPKRNISGSVARFTIAADGSVR